MKTRILIVIATLVAAIGLPWIVAAQDTGTATTEIGTIIMDVVPMYPSTNQLHMGWNFVPPTNAVATGKFDVYACGSNFPSAYTWDLKVSGTNDGYMKTDSGKTLGNRMKVQATDQSTTGTVDPLRGTDTRILNDLSRTDSSCSGTVTHRTVSITLTQALNRWTDAATSSNDPYWITITWTVGTGF